MSFLEQLQSEPDPVTRFKQLYMGLHADSLSEGVLQACYSDDVLFSDPAHTVRGINELHGYFAGMYENVQSIEFEFANTWQNNDAVFVRWQMRLVHPKLNSGRVVLVDGGSELHIKDNKVVQHQDIFDMGQMLYEHVPVLSWLIKMIKRRLSA